MSKSIPKKGCIAAKFGDGTFKFSPKSDDLYFFFRVGRGLRVVPRRRPSDSI